VFRFYALPAWQLEGQAAHLEGKPDEVELSPVDAELSVQSSALEGIEYRGEKAGERVNELLAGGSPAVFARSPNDLAALLRTADQLLMVAKVDAGEKAQLWRCTCGTRYAVPVALVRPVSLRCERCGNTVELDPTRSLGESSITDTRTAQVNSTRVALSEFFREAMARSWPVMVARA
jgi:hypothetical protein